MLTSLLNPVYVTGHYTRKSNHVLGTSLVMGKIVKKIVVILLVDRAVRIELYTAFIKLLIDIRVLD